jgi:hypothetical protein
MLHNLSSATRDTITIAMTWPTAEALVITVPLPDGYRYELLRRSEVPALINVLDDWFPGLAVGNASCFLREDFYANRVFFEGRADLDFFVLLFKRGDDWAGVLSVERDKGQSSSLRTELARFQSDIEVPASAKSSPRSWKRWAMQWAWVWSTASLRSRLRICR